MTGSWSDATTVVGSASPVSYGIYGIGTSAPPTLNGLAATTMAGWELVGNYGDMVEDTTTPYNVVNSFGKASG